MIEYCIPEKIPYIVGSPRNLFRAVLPSSKISFYFYVYFLFVYIVCIFYSSIIKIFINSFINCLISKNSVSSVPNRVAKSHPIFSKIDIYM